MTTLSPSQAPARGWLSLTIFLALVIGVGALIGTQTRPGDWYAALQKPWFNPPNWVFAPVWFVLYAMIAGAGWRVWTTNARSVPMALWVVQIVLNWAWSPAWFGLEQPWLAFAIIAALWLTIVAFLWTTRRLDRVAMWLFVPYFLWVSFALSLNLSIALLN